MKTHSLTLRRQLFEELMLIMIRGRKSLEARMFAAAGWGWLFLSVK